MGIEAGEQGEKNRRAGGLRKSKKKKGEAIKKVKGKERREAHKVYRNRDRGGKGNKGGNSQGLVY